MRNEQVALERAAAEKTGQELLLKEIDEQRLAIANASQVAAEPYKDCTWQLEHCHILPCCLRNIATTLIA